MKQAAAAGCGYVGILVLLFALLSGLQTSHGQPAPVALEGTTFGRGKTKLKRLHPQTELFL